MSDETISTTTNARLSRLETRYEELAQTVGRIEQTLKHSEELWSLRFRALEMTVGQLATDLKGFMARIEGMISGEVETVQSRQGRELVDDYRKWRNQVETRLDNIETFATQGRLLGRILVIVLGGNALVLLGAIAALVTRG